MKLPHRQFDPHRQLGSVLAFLVISLALLFPAAPATAQPSAPKLTVSAHANTAQLLPGQQHVIAVVVDVPNGFHAQSATPVSDAYIPLRLDIPAPPAGVKVLPTVYPPGIDETYPLLGKLNVYTGRVVVYVPLTVDSTSAPGTELAFKATVTAQLCDDKVCFIPDDYPIELKLTVAPAGTQVDPAADPTLFAAFDWSKFGQAPDVRPPPAAPNAPVLEKVLGFDLSRSGHLLPFALAIVVGLIFNVMPCVLPVLPLKAIGFYEAAQHSRGRSLFLGAVFTVGMIAAFAGLGVLISVFKFGWGQLFQYAWFVAGMSIVLLIMAASMWGLFTLSLPTAVYAVEPRHDTIGGNLFYGGLTALLATPCTAPMFAPLTVWAASQSALIGILFFVFVGIGMALPYVVLSAFPNLARKLPRTGPWSELVKQMLGFLILGTAVWLAGQRWLPGMSWTWGVVAVAFVAGVFLVIRTAKLMPRPTPIALAACLALLISTSTLYGANWLNQKPVAWTPYSDAALSDARAAGRTVLVKFTANWCGNCHYVEASVFTNKDVKAALASRDVVLLKVDLTHADAPGSLLLRQLSPAGGIPLTALYLPQTPNPVTLTSIYTPSTLLAELAKTSSDRAAATH